MPVWQSWDCAALVTRNKTGSTPVAGPNRKSPLRSCNVARDFAAERLRVSRRHFSEYRFQRLVQRMLGHDFGRVRRRMAGRILAEVGHRNRSQICFLANREARARERKAFSRSEKNARPRIVERSREQGHRRIERVLEARRNRCQVFCKPAGRVRFSEVAPFSPSKRKWCRACFVLRRKSVRF